MANLLESTRKHMVSEGRDFTLTFRTSLEHAFTARLAQMNGDMVAFENNVRTHFDDLMARAKKGVGFIK